jgi:pyruvate, water dikinase
VKKEDRIQESFTTIDLLQGKPVVTFDRLMSRTRFPAVLRAAMQKIRKHYGIELDVEMCAQLTANGDFSITMLQCRPQSLRVEQMPAELPQVPPEDVVFSCVKEVPSGRLDDVRFLVYVNPDTYARIETIHDRYEIARIVGRINQAVEQHPAILLGPGRWGSSNILLGVPVKYYEINNFKLLGEVAKVSNGTAPEVSYGTHFFQDLVETGIHCLPIYPGQTGVVFNEAFLNDEDSVLSRFVPADIVEKFSQVVRVIDMQGGPLLQVRMNGKTDQALCFRGSKEI